MGGAGGSAGGAFGADVRATPICESESSTGAIIGSRCMSYVLRVCVCLRVYTLSFFTNYLRACVMDRCLSEFVANSNSGWSSLFDSAVTSFVVITIKSRFCSRVGIMKRLLLALCCVQSASAVVYDWIGLAPTHQTTDHFGVHDFKCFEQDGTTEVFEHVIPPTYTVGATTYFSYLVYFLGTSYCDSASMVETTFYKAWYPDNT